MNKQQQKVLAASLAGLVIVSAAALAISPALAAGYAVEAPAVVSGVGDWDVLNVRKWPAAYSVKVGELQPEISVWVERCIEGKDGASDWCLIENGEQQGWVNASFLTVLEDWDI